jgi:hypothetical protein
VVDRSVLDLRDQAERQARARRDRWARAYAAGRMISIDTLLNDIERVIKRTEHPASCRAGLTSGDLIRRPPSDA